MKILKTQSIAGNQYVTVSDQILAYNQLRREMNDMNLSEVNLDILDDPMMVDLLVQNGLRLVCRHWHNGNSNPGERLKSKYVSVAYVLNQGGEILGCGYARCRNSDTPSRPFGREIAAYRAIFDAATKSPHIPLPYSANMARQSAGMLSEFNVKVVIH